MTEQMYHDYRVKQLVDDTIKSALKAASSMESDRITVIENPNRSEVEEVDDIIIDDYTFSENSDDGNTTDSGLQLEVGDLARAHWIQLHKTNKQGIVVQNCFIYILSKYKHLRPIWQFGKKIEDNEDDWKAGLYEDFYFRHHCASIQAGLTMVMENKDDPESIKKLLNEIGAHHFFYDACEPHLEIFQEGMIESMKRVLTGSNQIDADTEISWKLLLNQVKAHVGDGIAIQRNTYMKQCMTYAEMEDIRAKWERVVEFGLLEAGELLCETAVKIYTNLLSRHHLRMPIPDLQKESETFSRFAEFTIMALDVVIKSYRDSLGFCDLPNEIKNFFVTCMLLEVCPTLIRKAFMEGLLNMLSKVLGENEINETLMHSWSKIYRVLEQAVIINIVEY